MYSTVCMYVSIEHNFIFKYLNKRKHLEYIILLTDIDTCDQFIWHPLGHQFHFMDWIENALDGAKHGGKAQAEEHDEEQHSPDLRAWHLYHSLSEHNKCQAST